MSGQTNPCRPRNPILPALYASAAQSDRIEQSNLRSGSVIDADYAADIIRQVRLAAAGKARNPRRCLRRRVIADCSGGLAIRHIVQLRFDCAEDLVVFAQGFLQRVHARRQPINPRFERIKPFGGSLAGPFRPWGNAQRTIIDFANPDVRNIVGIRDTPRLVHWRAYDGHHADHWRALHDRSHRRSIVRIAMSATMMAVRSAARRTGDVLRVAGPAGGLLAAAAVFRLGCCTQAEQEHRRQHRQARARDGHCRTFSWQRAWRRSTTSGRNCTQNPHRMQYADSCS